MGRSALQYLGLAGVLLLAGCGDDTVEVNYSHDDRGRKMPEPELAKREQCFGIALAQYNDGTAGCDECAGTAPKDYMPDTWKYVAAGTCAKHGGSLKAGKASE